MESLSTLSPSDEIEKLFFTYRMDISYIGTEFKGWQSQPKGNTIQDNLEKAIAILLKESCRIVGASRTDTGVHAEHQVATFRTATEIQDLLKFKRSLNALIPRTVTVHKVFRVSEDFHPIFSCSAKLYRYRVWHGDAISPFLRDFSWQVHGILDVNSMIEAAKFLIGRHNFKSFCASDATVTSFEREIFDIQWRIHNNVIEFYVLGGGFLKQMVRCIVGTLIEVGLSKRSVDSMVPLLKAEDRTKTGRTAPSEGLSLVRIFYEPKNQIPPEFFEDCKRFGINFDFL